MERNEIVERRIGAIRVLLAGIEDFNDKLRECVSMSKESRELIVEGLEQDYPPYIPMCNSIRDNMVMLSADLETLKSLSDNVVMGRENIALLDDVLEAIPSEEEKFAEEVADDDELESEEDEKENDEDKDYGEVDEDDIDEENKEQLGKKEEDEDDEEEQSDDEIGANYRD